MITRSGRIRQTLFHGCIFIICTLIFHSCTAYRAERLKNKSYREWKAYQWNQDNEYDENGQTWTTYSRKVEGSDFKEFKITGEINVSPATAVEVLRERTENSQNYLKKDEGYIEVLSSNDREAVVYSVYKLPFPFKDRAMCEHFSFMVEKESGIHKITWAEDWDLAPQKKEKVINMPIARGSWEFEPIGKHRSRATYIVHTDPGGSIPAWMVNATIGKGLSKELKDIETIAQTFN